MDLTKAFGAVNRNILWTTLCEKGAPIQTILHVKRGHRKTTLQAKYNRTYGEKTENNIGVFQGSAISALLFTIYLQDTMEYPQAINYLDNIPYRATKQRSEKRIIKELINQIRTQEQSTTKNELTTNNLKHIQKESTLDNLHANMTERMLIKNYNQKNIQKNTTES